jgi:hypothetical protein
VNPTILLPRLLALSYYCSSTPIPPIHKKRGTNTNPFHHISPHHTRRLSNMASTKEYRLLCLENPLLGK